MYFQLPSGDWVLKTASRDLGVFTANRLVNAAGARGAGAKANRRALVAVNVAKREAKTMTLRLDFFFFTSVSRRIGRILGRVR